VKQLREQYFKELDAWNKVHRIFGSNRQEIYKQSVEALSFLKKEHLDTTVLVDVGAGAGFLAFAWICEGFGDFAYIVEPSLKPATFMRYFLSTLNPSTRGAFKLVDCRFEDVSRETSSEILEKKPLFCSRAFSSDLSLREIIQISPFSAEKMHIFKKTVAPLGKTEKYRFIGLN